MLLKLIEAFVPETLVLVHPSRNLPKGFRSKRYVNFAPLPLALNQARPFQQLQVLRHRVQGSVEWLCNVRKSGRSTGQLPNNRSPSRMRNRCQHICQLIHGQYYTIRCNIVQEIS